MFKGIRYRLHGFKDLWIAPDERDGKGVATVMYSQLRDADKPLMARRLLAALNMTSNMTLEELEAAEALPATDAIIGAIDAAQLREAAALLGNLAHAGPRAHAEAVQAIAAMGYKNGLRDAIPHDGRQVGWMCPGDPDAGSAFSWGRDLPNQLPPKCSTPNCGCTKIRVWVRSKA